MNTECNIRFECALLVGTKKTQLITCLKTKWIYSNNTMKIDIPKLEKNQVALRQNVLMTDKLTSVQFSAYLSYVMRLYFYIQLLFPLKVSILGMRKSGVTAAILTTPIQLWLKRILFCKGQVIWMEKELRRVQSQKLKVCSTYSLRSLFLVN